MLVTIYVRTCLVGKTEVLIHGFLRFSSLNSIALRAVILTHFSRLGEEVSQKNSKFSRKPSWNYRDILADVHWPLNDTKNI